MDGMTRSEIDKAEASEMAPRRLPLRPRDSATLILLDQSDGDVRVMMGRRHRGHAFMPGKFVFPGGRTDRDDSRIAVEAPVDPEDASKLGPRANALALSAIRETFEEAGLLVGRPGRFATRSQGWRGFSVNGVVPTPSSLRFVARAITPPGRVRRFDTRFFAAWRESVAREIPAATVSGELEDLHWLTLEEARTLDLPSITHTIIGEVADRLREDPLLRPGGTVPFYRMVGNRFSRGLL
jgi:8-oxo-dGTP pyrophosphatase MutT (NUDIX family)